MIVSRHISGRVKRHFSFSGHKWNKTSLTYKFFNFAKGSLTPTLQRIIVRRAFQAWEDISPLNFVDVTPNKRHYVKSDITIAWVVSFKLSNLNLHFIWSLLLNHQKIYIALWAWNITSSLVNTVRDILDSWLVSTKVAYTHLMALGESLPTLFSPTKEISILMQMKIGQTVFIMEQISTRSLFMRLGICLDWGIPIRPVQLCTKHTKHMIPTWNSPSQRNEALISFMVSVYSTLKIVI